MVYSYGLATKAKHFCGELHFVCRELYKSFRPAILIHHLLIPLFCPEQENDTSQQSPDTFRGLQVGLNTVTEHGKSYKRIYTTARLETRWGHP